MKINAALALCLVALLTFSAHAQEKSPDAGTYQGDQEDLHIYLLIGQSNMAGRAAIEEAQTKPIDQGFLLNAKDTWEPAANPLNQYSTIRKGLGMQKLGPGYSFATAMRKHNPDASIGLVVNAKGGSKIESWKPGSKFYNEALRRLKAAQTTGTIKGILWHQGESNSGSPEGYLDKLEILIASLRKDLGMPDLPFIAGQIQNHPGINKQIAKLPETVASTRFVSTEGLTTRDRWHFDNKSIVRMGERYAALMIDLQKEQAGKTVNKR